MFDTGTDAKGGGYEPFDTKIIEWYKKTRDSLKEKNGDYIPSLVFQHIPMFEHYNVLKQVKKSEKGAIPAFRIHKGEYYKIDETKCVPGSVLLEPPSIPDINTGEFEALKEKGDILGVYVGHDHKNSYVGKYDGIDIGFTQSSGFNVYGNGKERGVRCFVIDENDPKHYETYTKTYRQLCNGKLQKPVYDALAKVCISLISKVEYLKACKKKTKNYWSVRWNLIFGELRRTMIVRLKKNGIMRIIIRAIPELTRQLMKK